MILSEDFTRMHIPRTALRLVLAFAIATPIHFTLSAQTEAEVNASIKKFTQVYEAVEANFANKVDPDHVVYRGAIPGMLRTLDPHSNFFDPKAYALMREDQKGHYFGVGMSVGSRGGKTVVMWPFPVSPAYKAGLRPGDIIMMVNDKATDGLSTSEI